MDSLLDDFWSQGVGWRALHRRDPPYLSKYIIILKLTKYSRWKLSGWLVRDWGGWNRLFAEDSLVAFVGR